MTSVPAATSATRKSRPQTNLTVLRREQLSPHMVRIVAGGPGFAGYVNNDFVDRYVKIVFPQPGVDYPEPLDLWEIRETMPRDQWPHTRTYTVRWVDEAAAGTGHRLRDPRRRRPGGAVGGVSPARRRPDLHRPGRRVQPGSGRGLVPVRGRRVRAAGHRRRHRIAAGGCPRPRLPRGGQRRRHPGDRRAGRRRTALAAAAAASRPAPANCWSPRCATPTGPTAGCRSLPTASVAT